MELINTIAMLCLRFTAYDGNPANCQKYYAECLDKKAKEQSTKLFQANDLLACMRERK